MGRVGSAATVPSGQRAKSRQFPAPGLHVGRRAAREEGRRRGLGRSWGERSGDGPPFAHSPSPPDSSTPGSRTPGWGEGVSTLSLAPGWILSPSSRDLKVEFTNSCEGKPKVTWAEPGTRPQRASHRCREVSGIRAGRSLWPCLSGAGGPGRSAAGAAAGPGAGSLQHLGELRLSPDPAGSAPRHRHRRFGVSLRPRFLGPTRVGFAPHAPAPRPATPNSLRQIPPLLHPT